MTQRWWNTYLSAFGVLIALSFAYGLWRQSTLEPFTKRVDLSRTGRHQFRVSGFYPSNYHFGIRVYLPEGVTPNSFWFSENHDQMVWGTDPPILTMEVLDDRGRVMLRERSELTEENGWTFSGGIHGSLVEIYKVREFRGRLFTTYTVFVNVDRASRTIPAGDIFLSVEKAYALLPNAMLTIGLILLLIFSLPLLAVVSWVSRRRRT